MRIRFEIPMVPRGKGAARRATIRTKSGSTFQMTHKDPKTETFESAVAALAAAHLPAAPLDGPIRMDVLIVLPRPQRLKNAAVGLHWAPVKPDRDNCMKALNDALKSFWTDDARVVCGEPLKCYAEAGGRPRLVVLLETALPSPTAVARGLGLID